MCHQQFYETGRERWAHFGHNAHRTISITYRNMWRTAQQNEPSLKVEGKTQAAAGMVLIYIVQQDVSKTSTVNYNHQICTQNTKTVILWKWNWVMLKITWNIPRTVIQRYVGSWAITACHLKMSDQRPSNKALYHRQMKISADQHSTKKH